MTAPLVILVGYLLGTLSGSQLDSLLSNKTPLKASYQTKTHLFTQGLFFLT